VVDSFTSKALGIKKTFLVYVPASYRTSRKRSYPVAYFLHGATRGERYWNDSLRLGIILDSLLSAGAPEMLVVMPDGDDSFYHTWVNPWVYNDCLARGTINGEPAATYCVPHMKYDDYIINDLIPHIDSTYRTLKTRQHRAIAGYSMGAGGGLYLALKYRQLFGAIASLSGGILDLLNVGTPDARVEATDTAQLHQFYSGFAWVDFSMANQYGGNLSDWRKYDPYTIALTVPVDSFPSMWFMVGTYDTFGLPGNQSFHDLLVQRGVSNVTYGEAAGAHTPDFWRTHDGDATAWVAEQIKP